VADALAAPFAGRLPIELCTRLGVDVVLVTDDQVREAFRFLYSRAKFAVEPGAAAAVAAVMCGMIEGENVVSVVSGGNVSPEVASAILAGR
jgi:threo-3-hydroxy-L-aspartate ammonia-lyase